MDTESDHDDGARLPRGLGEALDRLEEDDLELETRTQSKAMQNYLKLKRCEVSKLHDMGGEEARLFLTELF
ncbi:hypothetical protein OCS_03864 [Ophiocordyceps sinensis CO18]|uniref:Uncharacterized protein n=1 Tax=Ophiocordyceps sinensis (strain Co18 / CGMCC 3.14243) TaxID=911162 RepID=T5AF03_OPHSC|nr:hypothetical protein OCS_03864 [Ophiocordyceps sinensis CO18]